MLGLLIFFTSCKSQNSETQQETKREIAGSAHLRAPAYPLVTHNPNFSIWSMTDKLNEQPTKHWTGKDQSLLGIVKVDDKFYRFMGKDSKIYESVLPTSDEDTYTVAYSEQEPTGKWTTTDYDDSSWKKGEAPFSDNETLAKTVWRSNNLYFRRSFDLANTDYEKLYLKLRHDDNVTVFLNGDKIYDVNGWDDSFKFIPIKDAVKGKLKPTGNVLAVHIRNTAGGQWLDAGLATEAKVDNATTIEEAEQTSVQVSANETQYSFTCGGIDLTATFTSPLLIEDLKVYARPVTYLDVQATSNDETTHEVKVYLGASSGIATNMPTQAVEAVQYEKNGLATQRVGTTAQPVLEKKGDDLRIDWGYFYISSPVENTTQFITGAKEAIASFTSGQMSPSSSLPQKNLMLNTVADLGEVSGPKDQLFLLGYDEEEAINYFGTSLKPWHKKEAESFDQILANAYTEHDVIITKVKDFDQKLYDDALAAGGEKYADLCVLAYRQAIAAHTLVESPDGDILFLSKENNSNGSINTVDVTYPSAPLFLVYNPDLLKGMLNGIFYYSESGKWKKPFAAHDLGTYPIATGQTYGEDMPVEEAGNMIILTAAIAQQEGNADYAKEHWETLTIWADFLMQSGFDPANQLSTDDFAGHLARNANLSIKAIMAIASYGKLADMLGEKETADKYTAAAKDFAQKWVGLAKDGDHYELAFEQAGTWSQKYNMVWDDILDLNIFPDDITDTEIAYYLTKQNKYGLPLDSRKTYTKSDWIIWTATMAPAQEDFKAIVAPVWKFVDETPDRVPLSDWHETTDGHKVGFKARSVVGGYFIKMLKDQK
ncbi:MAG: glutaminase [Cytophagaceae bacterium]|nr:glutaminase [Cytophagaceae bacterium]